MLGQGAAMTPGKGPTRRGQRLMKDVVVKGVSVPALGFGTWALTGGTCRDAVSDALAIGYRHIDTAQMYGNEAEVGAAIRASSVPRDQIFLTTKVAPDRLSTEGVRQSTDESLRKLGLDQVDLLLIHWPSQGVPLAETLGAFAGLREAGKTRFIGVSNFTLALLGETVETIGADILCNQVEYHPFLSQHRLLDYQRPRGIMLTAYSPLGRGLVQNDPTIAGIAHKHGVVPGQVGLRWLVDQDGVSAIPRSSDRAHIEANFRIFDFRLDAEDRAALDALGGNRRVVNPAGWAPEWDAV
jgi:2,5-diketo-D-gluconate reductase B